MVTLVNGRQQGWRGQPPLKAVRHCIPSSAHGAGRFHGSHVCFFMRFLQFWKEERNSWSMSDSPLLDVFKKMKNNVQRLKNCCYRYGENVHGKWHIELVVSENAGPSTDETAKWSSADRRSGSISNFIAPYSIPNQEWKTVVWYIVVPSLWYKSINATKLLKSKFHFLK